MNTHWHILGAGAIGCLWAKWLFPNATLLIKPDSEIAQQFHLGQNKKTIPFDFESEDQCEQIDLPCCQSYDTVPIENLLICTKAHQTEQAIQTIKLADNANIVLLQNGMGNHTLLQSRFPQANVFCGSTTHGAFRKGKRTIVHAGLGETYIGQVPANTDTEKLSTVCQSLENSFETIHMDTFMEKRLWLKLAINCAINPLTVIYQYRNGELLESEEARTHVSLVCREIDLVLHAKNFLNENESCFPIIEQVIKDTASNYSSMFQDFLNQRISEIDFIQGYLCKEAQKLNIPVPENQNIYTTIKNIEANY